MLVSVRRVIKRRPLVASGSLIVGFCVFFYIYSTTITQDNQHLTSKDAAFSNKSLNSLRASNALTSLSTSVFLSLICNQRASFDPISVSASFNNSLISTPTLISASTLSTTSQNISSINLNAIPNAINSSTTIWDVTASTPSNTLQFTETEINRNVSTNDTSVTKSPPNIACNSSKTSFKANLSYTELDILEGNFKFASGLQPGGIWTLPNANITLAIIIPYRKGESHLSIFLLNMHTFLQLQNISYSLLAITQDDDNKFNRGALFNIGFHEALRMNHSNNCYFFHDADFIPESGNLTYCCSEESIIHYASAMSTMNWTMPYDGYFGGVVAATAAQFRKVNGYANRFWDRGGEDDELKLRAEASDQRVSRIPITEGRYLTFKHENNKGNETNPEQTINLAETSKMWKEDGLNSVNYTSIAVIKKKYYIEIKVKL